MVTYDVVDTLNQRWGPRRIRTASVLRRIYILRAAERYPVATVVRIQVKRHRRIALHRGANNDVARLFGLLTARGATFDRCAGNPREKITRTSA